MSGTVRTKPEEDSIKAFYGPILTLDADLGARTSDRNRWSGLKMEVPFLQRRSNYYSTVKRKRDRLDRATNLNQQKFAIWSKYANDLWQRGGPATYSGLSLWISNESIDSTPMILSDQSNRGRAYCSNMLYHKRH